MTRVEVAPGFSLNVERTGSGPAFVLLHGFTGSARSWSTVLDAFAADHTVLAVDIAGHGDSDSPAELAHYRMPRVAEDIITAVRAFGVERASWLGYSMGGRTALALAAAFPHAVERLVLVGASLGLPTEAERAARRASDEALAGRIEREGIPAFVDYWENIPLFASQHALPEERRSAIRAGLLRNSPVGLANSLRGMGTGAQEYIDPHAVAAPTLALAGELDTKFAALGAALARDLPDGRFVAIAGAGHAAHLENPAACIEAVLPFLAAPLPKGVSA